MNSLDKYIDLDTTNHRPLAFFGIKIDESHESIREWVRWCKKQGFGGFNIIVATDCDGRANESWINMLLNSYEVAIETAAEEGLEVWIFDDWGYPSGTAGGLVCTEPSYRLKRLTISYDCSLKQGDSISVNVPEKLVSAGIFSEDDQYRHLPLQAGQKLEYTAKAASERIVLISWEFDKHASKSSCKSYKGDPAMSCIDMLNPDAARKFIEVMHEVYYQRFSSYFGTVIKGFFYDEPYLSFQYPWTEKLPAYFAEEKGYDLLEILPYMLVNADKSGFGQKKHYLDDFYDVWTNMAARNFYGELRTWCSNHGVELSGHLDLDHHLNTLSTISGHFYKNMAYNNRPAIDVIWAQIAKGIFTDYPRYAGSVRRLLGAERATSETFAGMGQGLYADLMRYIIDHQAVRGINDFHLMYSNNSPSHPENPQMPNHMLQEPFGKLIYERIAKTSAIASIGTPKSRAALYIPTFDIYRTQLALCRLDIDNAQKLPWEWVNEISEYLNYLPYDFDYIWDEAFSSLSIKHGGFLTGSGYMINTIILPPNCSLTDTAIERLREFHKAGGKIVSVFGVNWKLEKESVVCGELQDLCNYLDRSIYIEPHCKISSHINTDGPRTVYMLLNESNSNVNAKISLADSGDIFELDMLNGGVQRMSAGDSGTFTARFSAGQMRVFIAASMKEKSTLADTTDEIDETRCVVTDQWFLELPDNKLYNLGADKWKDWCELGYPTFSGCMRYKGKFNWEHNEERAVICFPELKYHAIVLIDGCEAGKVLFSPYELEISSLKPGPHSVEVIVYNTTANEVCGTLEVQKTNYSKRFALMADVDRNRLTSGLLQSPCIYPIKNS